MPGIQRALNLINNLLLMLLLKIKLIVLNASEINSIIMRLAIASVKILLRSIAAAHLIFINHFLNADVDVLSFKNLANNKVLVRMQCLMRTNVIVFVQQMYVDKDLNTTI